MIVWEVWAPALAGQLDRQAIVTETPSSITVPAAIDDVVKSAVGTVQEAENWQKLRKIFCEV